MNNWRVVFQDRWVDQKMRKVCSYSDAPTLGQVCSAMSVAASSGAINKLLVPAMMSADIGALESIHFDTTVNQEGKELQGCFTLSWRNLGLWRGQKTQMFLQCQFQRVHWTSPISTNNLG